LESFLFFSKKKLSWLVFVKSKSSKEKRFFVFLKENYPIYLNFTENAKTSKLYGNADPKILSILADPKTPVTMNNHVDGVEPSTYSSNSKLSSFFNVLSTNVDRKGREFVSGWESKKYPIYGIQWHPEKNPFEWNLQESLPHSPEAVMVAQYMSNFFVSESRKNNHHFKNIAQETAALIYNYSPVFTNTDFEQCYFWSQ